MIYAITKPILFMLDPERAHQLTLDALSTNLAQTLLTGMIGNVADKPCTIMGINFPNPVGLAAGMDKNAKYINQLSKLGFGFIEVGTVTPRPQKGNPKPRLFRLPAKQAIINRMGFNNDGIDRLVANIKNLKQTNFNGILGINLGKNANTPIENALDDYIICLLKAYPVADYLVLNISSPNTQDLRQLQHGAELDQLLSGIKQAQTQASQQYAKYVPLAVKIAPDLQLEQLKFLSERLMHHQIDAIIATNTTIERDGVANQRHADQNGGLSGEPLRERATQIVAQLKQLVQHEMPIIASGGVMSPAAAKEKLQAGASLVQIYSGLIYYGPTLVRDIVREL